jgi:hypothetical protein
VITLVDYFVLPATWNAHTIGMVAAPQAVDLGDLGSKILVAVIGAALGFASALALDYLKARREPHKQLSWSATTEKGLVSVGPAIREKVTVYYEGARVDELVAVQCHITNTGNRVVKNTRLRFHFADTASILEAGLDPRPEPELGVEEVLQHPTQLNERSYSIGHIERRQTVHFRFVASGSQAEKWTIHPFHDDGDLEFQTRDAAQERADREHLVPFIVTAVLLVFVPPILDTAGLIPLLPNLARLVLLGFLLPHVTPIARLLDTLIARYLREQQIAGVTISGQRVDITGDVIGHDQLKTLDRNAETDEVDQPS